MKLGRILRSTPDGTEERVVLVEPDADRVIDLARAFALVQLRRGATPEAARRVARAIFPSSMAAAIGAGDIFIDSASDALAAADDASSAIGDVQWTGAVDPPVIRDGLTFSQHIKQFTAAIGGGLPNPNIYKTPGYFKGSTGTVYGQDQEIPYPSFTEYLDYELEIGYVIGKPGRSITPDEAFDHVFGITIFNDFSARDLQGSEMAIGMGPQKAKDFAYGIGPWITTLDEIPGIEGLTGSITVNGELWSSCVAQDMVYTPQELVAYVSIADNLQPGDVIASGTLGNGSAFELGRKLSRGDVLELQLEHVGTLRNTISAVEETPPWWPEARPYPFAAEAAAAAAAGK